MTLEPIDLHHGLPGIIGSYLLETEDGPALFDCGPTTCVPFLKAGLAERGLDLSEVRHLLLSHIHLDHAGAAGVLVRQNPWLQVHVLVLDSESLQDGAQQAAASDDARGKQPRFKSKRARGSRLSDRDVMPTRRE